MLHIALLLSNMFQSLLSRKSRLLKGVELSAPVLLFNDPSTQNILFHYLRFSGVSLRDSNFS